MGPCKVFDLSQEPEVGADPGDNYVAGDDPSGMQFKWNSNSNLLAKAFHMLLHLADEAAKAESDWFCLLETDVYFVAANFRRLVTLLELSPKDSHWIGHELLSDIFQNGVAIEPNSGSCLSAFALMQIGMFFRSLVFNHRRKLDMHEYMCDFLGTGLHSRESAAIPSIALLTRDSTKHF